MFALHCVAPLASRGQLNLDRSEVHASVNGTNSNMDLRPGAYVTAGKGVMALVDTDTLQVEGYFAETKLPRIHVGNAVRIHLMGDSGRLTGHVKSIAAGIEDRDRAEGANLLANVNPSTGFVLRNASRCASHSTTFPSTPRLSRGVLRPSTSSAPTTRRSDASAPPSAANVRRHPAVATCFSMMLATM
jgi:multidrug resistance efflux pump